MKICPKQYSGPLLTNHSQEYSLSFLQDFANLKVTYCLASQELCYLQMPLNIEKCREQD